MKLLIIGIGNPTPSFIKRRLQALELAGVHLWIVAEYGQSIQYCKKATIIRVGGRQSLRSHTETTVRVLFNPFLFWKLVSIRTDVSLISRIKWATKYFPLTRVTPPDVVHFQWLSYLPEFKWLSHYFNCPFIGSARGSQLTVYPLTRPGYLEIMEDAIKRVDYIHCVSNDIAHSCLSLGARQEQLIINYNGVKLQHFIKVQKSKSAVSGFTLISVGALIWRKGFVYQLQILKKIKDLGKEVSLIIIGAGGELEALLYTAKMFGISDRVNFMGEIDASQLPIWLSNAQLYISTSAAEGLSNSVVEAAACKLPALAFSCEGMKEIISEGENGFIFPFGDVDGMANKIIDLMDNPAAVEAMGHKARSLVEEKFNEDYWVAQMIKSYHGLKKR